MAGLAQSYFVLRGVGLHVGGDEPAVWGALVAEDAPAHAAVVFSVPEGEGGAAGVAGVRVLIIDPGVWQAWWDVHLVDWRRVFIREYISVGFFFV